MKIARHNIFQPYMSVVFVCVAAALLPASAWAHTIDSVGEYRLELQWEVEPPYSGEVNSLKLYVSPLVPGLELTEQSFHNGIEGLEDTIKIQLATRDHLITLLPEPDEFIPGLYRAHILILKPGFYQANILGYIGEMPISLSLHPHEVRDARHITFPTEYGSMYDLGAAQQSIRTDIEENTDKIDALHSTIQDVPSENFIYMAVIFGIAGVVLGITALYVARRT